MTTSVHITEGWEDLAACLTEPVAMFFTTGPATKPAREVCGRCDVRDDCLAYALVHHIDEGIWGGLDERERRRLNPLRRPRRRLR